MKGEKTGIVQSMNQRRGRGSQTAYGFAGCDFSSKFAANGAVAACMLIWGKGPRQVSSVPDLGCFAVPIKNRIAVARTDALPLVATVFQFRNLVFLAKIRHHPAQPAPLIL